MAALVVATDAGGECGRRRRLADEALGVELVGELEGSCALIVHESARPKWTSAGVIQPMALWWCWLWYRSKKFRR